MKSCYVNDEFISSMYDLKYYISAPLHRLCPLEVCGLEEKGESVNLSNKNIQADKDNIIGEKTAQSKS